ncbi:hypothetical protein [Psychromicrobium sp. YIM B11713]|uniref:hypothetical protein n=1 Tax=Psychromicrobium sp. YIM B11713 TaxID=3145233 RepID=UPI00374E3A86
MLTAADIQNWFQINPENVDALPAIADAVNTYVGSLPNIDKETDGTWKGTTKLGALLIAGKLYARKSQPSGVNNFGETGPTYIPRWDQQVDMLLHLGDYRKPVIV